MPLLLGAQFQIFIYIVLALFLLVDFFHTLSITSTEHNVLSGQF
uniref:Uncharacterized protein n=1 Tax=Arundo donax TaxID=35708 RepID=A0A0A9DL12_ARUDO